ncbi:MAG: hypothetical protein Kow00127_21840 [Bacteroidales bacterium]
MKIRLVLAILAFLPVHLFPQEESWNLCREESGVKVYCNASVYPPRFRAETTVRADSLSVINILRDVEHFAGWTARVKESRLIKTELDSILIYSAVLDYPFPLKDRWIVYRNSYIPDSSSRSLRIRIEAVTEAYTPPDGLPKALPSEGFWLLTFSGNSRVGIVLEMTIDPGMELPGRLMESIISDDPLKTLLNLRERLSLNR